MKLQTYELLVQSLINDARRGKEISFLFGSAISLSDDGKGVPSVNGMVEIIREYLKEENIYEGYEDFIGIVNDSEKYQKSFEYILSVGEQCDVKNILQRSISFAKNEDGSWNIPKSIRDLADLILKNSFNIKNILTTNFDPLIEKALNSSELSINRIVLDSDSHINNSLSSNKNNLNIIHLHGFWEGDTMHTPNQLLATRDKLKSSLKDILSNSKLYVIGYGGWDDVFNETLKDIMNELKVSCEIRWAFYNNSDAEVREGYKKLFSSLNPAIIKGRFNGYTNVDCKKLFEDVYNKLYSVNVSLTQDINEILDIDENSKKKLITLEEIYTKKDNQLRFKLKEFNSPPDPAHEAIRIPEQRLALDYLNSDSSFTLLCGWGYGKLGFISSFLSYEYDNYRLFRVDLSDVTDKKSLDDKIIKDIGVNFTALIADDSDSNILVIIFDNIIDVGSELQIYLNELVEIIYDYSKRIKAIFISTKNLNLKNKKIELSPLSLVDTNEYIKGSGKNHALTIDELERLHRKSNGLPIKLDLIKSYLTFTSLEHILDDENGELELSVDQLTDNIPNVLLERIIELSKSESNDNKRLYDLLKVFCILECGELSKSITKHYFEYRFKLNDFSRLINMGLIYTTDIEGVRDFKINKINPLVKDYIWNLLPREDIVNLRRNAIKLVLGDIWKTRHVKISFSSKILFDYTDFHPGNPHVLLTSSLKQLDLDINEYELYVHASVSYCSYLNSESRYKELVTFSREIHQILSREKNLNYYRVIYYLAVGLRMLDNEQESMKLLKSAISKIKEVDHLYNKELHHDMLATLALNYKSVDDDEAFIVAEFLRKESSKNSYHRFLCESILASRLPHNEKIRKLALIEKRARSSDSILVANNISLDLASLLPDEKEKYINKVIVSEKNTYNKIRAFLGKFEVLFAGDLQVNLSHKDKIVLLSAYRYLFIQRMDSLFNKGHSLLWESSFRSGNIDELFSLFVTSSLVWRVEGNSEKELKYVKLLKNSLTEESSKNINNIIYVEKRYETLSEDKFLPEKIDS